MHAISRPTNSRGKSNLRAVASLDARGRSPMCGQVGGPIVGRMSRRSLPGSICRPQIAAHSSAPSRKRAFGRFLRRNKIGPESRRIARRWRNAAWLSSADRGRRSKSVFPLQEERQGRPRRRPREEASDPAGLSRSRVAAKRGHARSQRGPWAGQGPLAEMRAWFPTGSRRHARTTRRSLQPRCARYRVLQCGEPSGSNPDSCKLQGLY